MDAAAVDRPNQILRHNPTPTSVGDWELITWTTGTTYSPGESIDIGLHLTFTGKAPMAMPKATMYANLKHVKDPTELHSELTVPFKEVKGKASEWEVIMIDVFKTDSHHAGASILKEGEYLLDVKIVVERTIVLRPLDFLIKIDNVDGKNLIDYYREHYPHPDPLDLATWHNVMTSSVGDWKLTTWTTGSIFPPGLAIELGLRLIYTGQGPKPSPKATVRLNLKRANGPTMLTRELTVPFKEEKGKVSEWVAIMADVFKTDSHRADAWILQEGDYHVSHVLKINDGTTIDGNVFSIKIFMPKKD